jgi:hypothetical protein
VGLEVNGHEVQVTACDVMFDPSFKLRQQPLCFLVDLTGLACGSPELVALTRMERGS